MKKLLFIPIAAILASCGQSEVEKDADAVCDCLKKMKTSTSLEEKTKCLDLQRSTGEKYMNSPEDLQKFNETVTPCVQEMLGQ